MKRKRYFFLLLVLLNLTAYSQNLVINPSFEDSIPCSVYFNLGGEPYMPCPPWFLATLGSVDYFKSNTICAGPAPLNVFGFQYPRTGNVYVGFSIKYPFNNYREYTEGVLSDSLRQGHTYCVNFYVVAANNCKFASGAIGAFFSPDSIFNQNTDTVQSNYFPQINNPASNVISDTLNWTLISGSFVAQGGEKYITIGNFKDDFNTPTDSISGATYNISYYYLDDVSVVDCTVGINEIQKEQLQFSISPNPVKNKLTLQLQNTTEKVREVQIVNVIGAKVFEKATVNKLNRFETDVSFLPAGVYFIKVYSDKGIGVRKFLKL